jgi:tetratricopeptide (TPR) repeat protein
MKRIVIILTVLLVATRALGVPKEIEYALKLNRINHFDEALEVVETALQEERLKPDITSAYTIGRILAQVDHLLQIKGREGELSPELRLFLGIGYFYQKQYLEAAGILNQLVQLPVLEEEFRSLATVYLGASYYRTGEREKAQELWKSVDREHHYAYAALGYMYAYLSINPSTAEMVISRALESANREQSRYRSSIRMYHAYALMSAGRFTDAYREVNGIDLDIPIFTYKPDRQTEIRIYDLAILDSYSRILYGEAIKNLEPVVSASSGELASFASFYVAQMYLHLEDYDNCTKFAGRAQKLSVSGSLTMIRATACEGSVYYLEGREKRGKRIITKEMEGIYGKPSYLLEMMKVFIASGVGYGSVQDVIEEAEAYIFETEWDKTRRDTALLGELAFFSGQYQRALYFLEQARDKGNKNKIETNDPTFLLKLSYVYYIGNDFSESLEILFSLGKSFSGIRPLQDAVQSVYSYKQRGSGEALIE